MFLLRAVSVVTLLLLGNHVGTAAVVNSIDDFQDGTTQNWAHGGISPNPPQNISDVGPLGAGDDALEVISTGVGNAGSRLAVFNRASKWTGDYISAGITHINADVNNIGANPLSLRIGIGIGGGGGSGGRYVTDAILLSPGSGWTSISWSVLPSDLIMLTGSTNPATALTQVTELRIVSSVNAEFLGDKIAGTLRLDNIVAVAVPEPVGTSLVALVAVGFVSLRRRRKTGRSVLQQDESGISNPEE